MKFKEDAVQQTIDLIDYQLEALQSIRLEDLETLLRPWRARTMRLLADKVIADELNLLPDFHTSRSWPQEQIALDKALTALRAAIVKHPDQFLMKQKASKSTVSLQPKRPRPPAQTETEGGIVFVVHGHDEVAKLDVSRTLEKLELKAVILHEQPSKGRTIIEKFEQHAASAHFAVVLMSPDDIGHAKASPDAAKPRARQNVILELGYFIGRLGRRNVAVLYKSGVELPSDYLGVVYTVMDDAGAWKLALAKELRSSGLDVDINKLA